MKRNRIYQAMGGFLGAAMLLGMPSCTDDHYDIKTDGLPCATNTIWQNIEARQDLDSLAMILKRVRVYTREDDPNKQKMTYSEYLSKPQTVTFWAPVNGSYNAKHYLDQLDAIDELRKLRQKRQTSRSTSSDSSLHKTTWLVSTMNRTRLNRKFACSTVKSVFTVPLILSSMV